MYYGVGDGIRNRPLVGLDVEGHEYSHMVIDYRQNLYPDINNINNGLNYQGESGALNESFSDIFGTCIEFYAKPTTANWTIGEDFTLPAGSFMRSMSNPKSPDLNFSITHQGKIIPVDFRQPKKYKGKFWTSTTKC